MQRLHDTICQEPTGIGLMVGAMANQRRSTCPETERQLQEIAALVKHAGVALGELGLDLHRKDWNPCFPIHGPPRLLPENLDLRGQRRGNGVPRVGSENNFDCFPRLAAQIT